MPLSGAGAQAPTPGRSLCPESQHRVGLRPDAAFAQRQSRQHQAGRCACSSREAATMSALSWLAAATAPGQEGSRDGGRRSAATGACNPRLAGQATTGRGEVSPREAGPVVRAITSVPKRSPGSRRSRRSRRRRSGHVSTASPTDERNPRRDARFPGGVRRSFSRASSRRCTGTSRRRRCMC